MVDEVAELESVPLSEHWPNEETNFTPWLAENISRLSDVLNIDLEVQEMEANVGGYYADIYATDHTGERDIIIENQYGSSDHKHLGQCFVYAGGFNADMVVWIAEEFDDPYLDSIQWFNDRTNRETGFFAVEIGLVRIEDSPVAPRFDVIERPSNWIGSPEELTETEREHRSFWRQFEQRLEERELSEYASGRTSGTASYVTKSFGDVYIRPGATVHDDVYVMLRIEDESGQFGGLDKETVNQELMSEYSKLEETPVSESEIKEVEWDSNPGNLYDKIIVRFSEPIDRSDKDEWQTYHDWIADVTQIYDAALSDKF